MNNHLEENRLSKGQVPRPPKDWTSEEIREFFSEYREVVTIPVHVMVEGEQRVYSFPEVEDILRGAETIVLQDCVCRTRLRNCDAPVHTCILLDERAEARLRGKPIERNAEKVSLGKALETLKEANEAGLVLMALTARDDEKPTTICNCCSCCCHALSGLLRHDVAHLVLASRYVAENEAALCTGCGACVARCCFGARKMTNGKLFLDTSRCFGCGLCVSSCPAHAIRLTERSRTEPSSQRTA